MSEFALVVPQRRSRGNLRITRLSSCVHVAVRRSGGSAVATGPSRTLAPCRHRVRQLLQPPAAALPAARIGLFGGTFDPPHVGHLVTAVNVRHALALDTVILMVANIPWQKQGERAITPAADRLAMVDAAVADVPGLAAGRLEIDAGGPSYTADTLATLAAPASRRRAVHDRRRRRRRRTAHLGAVRGGHRPVVAGGRRSSRRGGATARRRRLDPRRGPPPGGVQHRPARPLQRRPPARLPAHRPGARRDRARRAVLYAMVRCVRADRSLASHRRWLDDRSRTAESRRAAVVASVVGWRRRRRSARPATSAIANTTDGEVVGGGTPEVTFPATPTATLAVRRRRRQPRVVGRARRPSRRRRRARTRRDGRSRPISADSSGGFGDRAHAAQRDRRPVRARVARRRGARAARCRHRRADRASTRTSSPSCSRRSGRSRSTSRRRYGRRRPAARRRRAADADARTEVAARAQRHRSRRSPGPTATRSTSRCGGRSPTPSATGWRRHGARRAAFPATDVGLTSCRVTSGPISVQPLRSSPIVSLDRNPRGVDAAALDRRRGARDLRAHRPEQGRRAEPRLQLPRRQPLRRRPARRRRDAARRRLHGDGGAPRRRRQRRSPSTPRPARRRRRR